MDVLTKSLSASSLLKPGSLSKAHDMFGVNEHVPQFESLFIGLSGANTVVSLLFATSVRLMITLFSLVGDS